MNPKTKAAKTRAKNARFRATKAKARSAAALSDKTLVETRAKAYADMEPHVGDIVRMGEIAAICSTRTRGFSSSPPRTLTRCCRRSGLATTPWTSRHEAPASIDQKAQPAATGRSRQEAQAELTTRARAQVRAFSIRGKGILPSRPIFCFRRTTYRRPAPAGQSEFWILRASLAQS
jgi:hypothetical protein